MVNLDTLTNTIILCHCHPGATLLLTGESDGKWPDILYRYIGDYIIILVLAFVKKWSYDTEEKEIF